MPHMIYCRPHRQARWSVWSISMGAITVFRTWDHAGGGRIPPLARFLAPLFVFEFLVAGSQRTVCLFEIADLDLQVLLSFGRASQILLQCVVARD